jgi:hypothetical protein
MALIVFRYMFIEERQYFYYMFMYSSKFYRTVTDKLEELASEYATEHSVESNYLFRDLMNEFGNICRDIIQ